MCTQPKERAGMARAVLWAFLAAAAVSAVSGCGTCINCLNADKAGPRNPQEAGRVYGGVRLESELVRYVVAQDSTPAVADCSLFTRIYATCFLGIDLPLTVVGDTLTLPYTILYTRRCQAEPPPEPDPPTTIITVPLDVSATWSPSGVGRATPAARFGPP
jgi:uncharacterized protein YceK